MWGSSRRRKASTTRFNTWWPGSSRVAQTDAGELKLASRMKQLVRSLVSQPDYELMVCFREIDIAASGKITKHSLQAFFE